MCEHQCAVEEQVQLHDEILCRSNVTATLYWARVMLSVTVADRWKPTRKIYVTVSFLEHECWLEEES